MFLFGAVCGVVAIAAFSWMMWTAKEMPELAPTVAGSLLAIGVCAAVWVYFQLGRGKSVLTAISVTTLTVGVLGLLAAWANYRGDELVVLGGLLVLAWWERSLLVAGAAAVLLLVGAVSLPPVTELVLVSAVLFLCAFVALARRKAVA
ncbi:hypothetical protein ALI144C_51675 [Actinosynnema sp. ALI-1.44]|nr:hypothetical protein ALI144C_51675 [Actinosynnema sp. ALI-1.44]